MEEGNRFSWVRAAGPPRDVTKVKMSRRMLLAGIGGLAVGLAGGYAIAQLAGGRGPAQQAAPGAAPPFWSRIEEIARERKLQPEHIEAAVKTYLPGTYYDEFYVVGSGGHSGQVIIVGLPSMKIYRVIAVFTPEPWQGWGYGDRKSMEILFSERSTGGRHLSSGDTHHPDFDRDETGEYVGKWAFIGDKVNGRAAAISLVDFETKDIVKIPNVQTMHGGAFTAPPGLPSGVPEGGFYVAFVTQYPAPWEPGKGYKLGVTRVPWSKVVKEEKYYWEYMRGAYTFLWFDEGTGKFDLARSFQLELPPYVQDLASIGGWGPSRGLAFCNSFGTEGMFGEVPYEAKLSKNDYDYLHVIVMERAFELCFREGKCREMNGIRVLPLDVAAGEGALYFVREPKSPHGNDISPSGTYNVIGGKLAPYTTVYDIRKIKQAIADGKFEGRDRYGVPILDYGSVVAAQIEVGLGPLHNEFDDKGYGYVSNFISNTVARYTLGPPDYTGDKPFTKVGEIRIHYNVGHLATPESNSPKPKGKYLLALNKWAIDRFMPVGPLFPQNWQLIDITGDEMKLLYDLPIGLGEPHYAKIISAEKVMKHAIKRYEPGTDPGAMAGGKFQKFRGAVTEVGKERVEVKEEGGRRVVEVYGTLIRSTIRPIIVNVKRGDLVRLILTNVEQTVDATHGFMLHGYNIAASLEPGETAVIEFVADTPGVFSYYCYEFCSPLHLEMAGWLIVEE